VLLISAPVLTTVKKLARGYRHLRANLVNPDLLHTALNVLLEGKLKLAIPPNCSFQFSGSIAKKKIIKMCSLCCRLWRQSVLQWRESESEQL
jgi:hypothetical protein